MRGGWMLSAALFFAAGAVCRGWPGAALPPWERPATVEHAVQDAGAVLAGARRLGGDVAYIQLLQYFSSTEIGDPAEGRAPGADRAVRLPRFLPNSLRIAGLSPFFHGAYLFAAGSLGFVLDRPQEALDLLAEGARRDPSFWRYRLYAGAIAYEKGAAPEKVIAFLEQALAYPDCPSLLQNILANLHKKRGNYRRAAEVYEYTARTSRDAAAVDTARRHLERLRQEGLVP